ncbi:MAG: NADH:quinone oxidoreductase, partial [Pseudomonadales bacterium]|nr:NADH:quinone oxidoreductase [Pseudomonadales bacterium]
LLWLLLAFFIGCIIGYLLRQLLAPEAGMTAAAPAVSEPETKAKAASSVVPARAAGPTTAKPAPATSPPAGAAKRSKTAAAKKAPTTKPKKARATGKPKRPTGLAAARGGKADNLQQISGVGPKLEKTLHGLGFFHFDQIAGWNSDEILWVEEHLRFKGRIKRDKWITQARRLAARDR